MEYLSSFSGIYNPRCGNIMVCWYIVVPLFSCKSRIQTVSAMIVVLFAPSYINKDVMMF